MEFKTTRKLFRGIYQYKIVLVVPGAGLFRHGDMNTLLDNLNKVDLSRPSVHSYKNSNIKNREDLDYAFKLQTAFSSMSDIDIRVETPWISVYTSNKKNIDKLINLDKDRVKYVSIPPANSALSEDTIIMPKMDFDFRVTLGKTNNECSAFVSWAETNSKVKLTKSCVRDLSKTRSWGGTHFYITGDNNLLMAKMHLGGCISKIERIVKK
jgi:hypothetical protein